MEYRHEPVMVDEVIDALKIKPEGIYLDCTVGAGGHSIEIARRLNEKGRLVALDRDPEAIKAAKKRLAAFPMVVFVHSAFSRLREALAGVGVDKADGVLFDLGVSSYQLDNPARGFTYMEDAPLDMRMDPLLELNASDIVNKFTKEDIASIIGTYGEERWAVRVAEFITAERKKSPITTTHELVEIIKKAIPAGARRKGPHPASRTFQALRIAVNEELDELEQALGRAVDILNNRGRICVISFHSLEDRIVKDTFRLLASRCICPPKQPICTCGKTQDVKIITRKPLLPSREEVERNPRSRSAKLRVAERMQSVLKQRKDE
ncbi:MAG TPA: 16S rRNA (cytosine(1402)-N(4))-methyltransferase RsmH [Clostridia bacterium]|nr:16S rRNA (cytosine(1402)-N(4))-methyltransferase RsmH [Clostridia bacterium]